MERFNHTRLDVARRRRGMTKQALAEAAGISTSILRAYERGDYEPTPATVEKIATALRFPISFFAAHTIDEPTLEGVSFRSLSAMTARQRDLALGSAAIAMELDDWIHRRFALPRPDVPRHDTGDPELVAEAVRQAWGLGERRAPNMVHLLESHGIRVFSLVEDCANVDAFSFWRDGVPYVFLNSMKTAERSRMDAAHELAHLVMHRHGGPAGREAEEQAHAFGAAFLMPRRSVLAEAPRGATVAQILKLKKRWNVSAMNLARRLHRLGLLTDWQARSTYIQLGQRGYRDGEPDGRQHETSQVLPKVFAALRAEGKSRRDVARELHVPVEELNRSVFGLTLASDDSGDRGAEPSAPTRPPDLKIVS